MRALGKKQLNHLMTLLDKGSAKEVLRGGLDKDPLRSVRAKREADEAGKESPFLHLQPSYSWQMFNIETLCIGVKLSG